MMNVVIAPSYEALSSAVADEIVKHLQDIQSPLFCATSGDTPTGVYRELVQRQQKGFINTKQWDFVGLDEWSGMNGQNEGSCRNYLDRELFGPLQTSDDHICFFDGKAGDQQGECKRIDQFINAHGGIDVMLLGLGLNGHVGMNEPGVDPALFSHVAELDILTAQVGQKYFSSETKLTHGLTLGIASMMQARHVILMVNGEKKSSIVQKVIEGEITADVPASLLRNHPRFSIFLDGAAASKLKRASGV